MTVSGLNPRLGATKLLAEIEPKLDALDMPPGSHRSVGGEVEASKKANQALFLLMPHCLVAIVVLLVWQFGSFRRTAIILLTIPLVLLGASLSGWTSPPRSSISTRFSAWLPSRASSSTKRSS